MSTYLHHVTLTTGDTRKSYRDEVMDAAVAQCAAMLREALSEPRRHASIPGMAGCTLTATAAGRALIATVWGPPTELRGSAPMRPPLVTFGVATSSRSGAKLWRILHQQLTDPAQVQTDPEYPPPAPWIGARIEIGVALLQEEMPDIMMMIGDMERVVGWAWMER